MRYHKTSPIDLKLSTQCAEQSQFIVGYFSQCYV